MSDRNKTKDQLIVELKDLRDSCAGLRGEIESIRSDLDVARKRAQYLQEILDSIPDVIDICGENAIVQYANKAIERFGFKRGEYIGKFAGDLYSSEDLPKMAEAAKRLRSIPIGQWDTIYISVTVPDGRRRNLEMNVVNRLDEPIRGLVGCTRDITDRRDGAQAFDRSDEAIRAVFNGILDAVCIHDRTGVSKYINDTMLTLFGMTRHDWREYPAADFYYREQASFEEITRIWNDVLNGTPQRLEWKCRRPGDGGIFDAEIFLNSVTIQDDQYILATIRDITERKLVEERLRKALDEREVLLREIHHRVKNNLALVSGVLKLQERRSGEENVQAVLRSAQRRVDSLAILHEKLYRSENLADLSARAYLSGLLDHLWGFYRDLGHTVQVSTDIEDVSFSVETAIPLGFILTELFSNCIKHAFPGRTDGSITVALRRLAGIEYELMVSDTGVGIRDWNPEARRSTLGLELVTIFVRQLDGDLDVSVNDGTSFRITFSG